MTYLRKTAAAVSLLLLLLTAVPAATGAQTMGVLMLERLAVTETWGTGAKAWGTESR